MVFICVPNHNKSVMLSNGNGRGLTLSYSF